jgi:hypothetical protein
MGLPGASHPNLGPALHVDPRSVSTPPECNGAHGWASWYAPALPFQQNAFSALAADEDNEEELIAEGMADQVAALTY